MIIFENSRYALLKFQSEFNYLRFYNKKKILDLDFLNLVWKIFFVSSSLVSLKWRMGFFLLEIILRALSVRASQKEAWKVAHLTENHFYSYSLTLKTTCARHICQETTAIANLLLSPQWERKRGRYGKESFYCQKSRNQGSKCRWAKIMLLEISLREKSEERHRMG